MAIYRLPVLMAGVRLFTVALAVILVSVGASMAQTPVNCTSSSGALQSFFNGNVPVGTTVSVQGTCVGQVFINNTQVTIQQAVAGGSINGALFITSSIVNINNITLNGVGAGNRGISGGGGSPGFATSLPSSVSLVGVTIENFPDSGVGGFGAGGSITISGGAITGNKNCGIYVSEGVVAQVSGTTISGNGTEPSDTTPGDQCGIHVENGGVATLSDTVVENNNGPALWISQGTVVDSGSSLSAPASVTMPAVVVRRGSFYVTGDTITGTGDSDAIFATPGSTVTMQGTAVSESDAGSGDSTVLVADGSTLLSLGGNTITNSATNGTAMTVANGSTFHQRNETSLGIAVAADTITGAGIAQIESNIELGTGASAASTWTGSIDAAQNSSIRMDGGITVNGSVTLAQASNGFFNLGNTGLNVVTGGVLCPFTTNQAAHVTGSARTVQLSQGGAIAVTFGTGPNDCLSF